MHSLSECQEFMDELSELGITTGEQFVKAYTYQLTQTMLEAEFYYNDFKTEVERIDLDKVIDYYKVTSGVGAIIVDGVIDSKNLGPWSNPSGVQICKEWDRWSLTSSHRLSSVMNTY